MSVTENREIEENNASTAVEEQEQRMASASETGSLAREQPQAVPVAKESGHGVKLCRHAKEDGVYCDCAAVGGRQYCYRHLRLRGQQMRMARALAQRQTYDLALPPLEDMNAVQAALTHVTAALMAGLLERRRAGQLLYALQQASSNLRFLAQIQTQTQSKALADVASPAGQPEAAAPPRVVEEYPEFEAEFGLPPGLDLALPPHLAFPPPEKTTTWAAAQTIPQKRARPLWTKETIELEELHQQRSSLSEESYNRQSSKVNEKIHKMVTAEIRQEREAAWEAEAARRNAEEEEKVRRWNSMDATQQRAYDEGVLAGYAAAEEERREEQSRAKKPAATVS